MIIDYDHRLCAYCTDKSGPGSITDSCFKCHKTYNQPIENDLIPALFAGCEEVSTLHGPRDENGRWLL